MLRIEGIEYLDEKEIAEMKETNRIHTAGVGTDYKAGMQIIKVWINKHGCICVKLKNGQWYHYKNFGWY